MLDPDDSPVTSRSKRPPCELSDEELARKRSRTEQANGRASHKDDGLVKAALIHIDETSPKETRWNTLIVGPQSIGGSSTSSTRKPRVRKSDLGKLERVLHLPSEILHEIATRLHPLDLLQLSRTNRDLRSYLMSKCSRRIWTACEEAIRLPPCPSDLSEPRYANLCFEKECHACGCQKGVSTIYTLRVRLCDDCEKLNIVRGKQLAEEVFGSEVSNIEEIYSLSPFLDETGRIASMIGLGRFSDFRTRSFLKSDFISTVKRYLDTKPNSEERDDFVRKQIQLSNGFAESSRYTTFWKSRRERERIMIRETTRARRIEQINEKLHSLGYCSLEIRQMSDLSHEWRNISKTWKRLVNQSREPTEISWKTLRPKLETLLLERRRLQCDRTSKKSQESR